MKSIAKFAVFAKISNFRHFGIALILVFAIALGFEQLPLRESITDGLANIANVCSIIPLLQNQKNNSQACNAEEGDR
jgi:hypothetical protein